MLDYRDPATRRSILTRRHGDQDCRPGVVLTLSCVDRVGIVAAVSGHVSSIDGFITESQQFADPASDRFFMRVVFQGAGPRFPADVAQLRTDFAPIAGSLALDWTIETVTWRPTLVIAVSKAGHCLSDLLYRWRLGALPVDIAAVVSNHDDLRDICEWHGLPYHRLPDGGPVERDARLAGLCDETGADYLILARYMRILPPALATRLEGRCINIHHSFLPSFKGARPYRSAHERGVKLIGATAHFVTPELDEGPIIEQAVERVDHRATEADMIATGRDIEAQVLARAVRWIAERRVILNGSRTVVFR